MGVDTLIFLPNDVRVRDVGDVIGILLGLPASQQQEKWGRYTEVEGVKVEGIKEMPECCHIILKGKMIDGEENERFLFHMECSDSNRKLIMPRSYPLVIALGLKLCEFFGGEVHYQDCEDEKPNKMFKKSRKYNNPDDGKDWQSFEDEKFKIKPLTKKDINNARKFACYV